MLCLFAGIWLSCLFFQCVFTKYCTCDYKLVPFSIWLLLSICVWILSATTPSTILNVIMVKYRVAAVHDRWRCQCGLLERKQVISSFCCGLSRSDLTTVCWFHGASTSPLGHLCVPFCFGDGAHRSHRSLHAFHPLSPFFPITGWQSLYALQPPLN